MAETRVCVAFHFTFDPAKELARIPETVTKTIAVGDELKPEKISSSCIGESTRGVMLPMMEKLVLEATRTAKPVKKDTPKPAAAKKEGEVGDLFGSAEKNDQEMEEEDED